MPGDPPTPAPPETWTERFRRFICELYRSLGGDCQDLPWADGGATAVAMVRARFDANGPPTFGSQEERDEYLATLSALETHLQSPESTITQQVSDEVQELIDDLRAAINPT